MQQFGNSKKESYTDRVSLRGSLQTVDQSQTGQATAGALARERDRSQLFLEINAAILSHAGLPELLKAIAACLRREIPHAYAGMSFYDSETNCLQRYALGTPEDVPRFLPIPL